MRTVSTKIALTRVIGGLPRCQSATERYFCQRMNMDVAYLPLLMSPRQAKATGTGSASGDPRRRQTDGSCLHQRRPGLLDTTIATAIDDLPDGDADITVAVRTGVGLRALPQPRSSRALAADMRAYGADLSIAKEYAQRVLLETIKGKSENWLADSRANFTETISRQAVRL